MDFGIDQEDSINLLQFGKILYTKAKAQNEDASRRALLELSTPQPSKHYLPWHKAIGKKRMLKT